VRTYPDKFSFLAVIPLPYTNASYVAFPQLEQY
jgi:hypothetical protein